MAVVGTRFLCGVIKNTLKIRLCQQVHNSVNVDSILNVTFPKRTVACELHLHHFSFSKENDKAVYKVNTPEPLGHATPRISLSSLEALGCVFFWTPSFTKRCQPNSLSQHRKFLGGFLTHLTLQQMVYLRLRSGMSNSVIMVFSLSLLHPQPLLLRSQPLRSILGLDQDVSSLRTFSLDPCPWLRVEVTNMS